MANNATLVHVTHEAVGKIGGIGAVLQGFFTCDSYLQAIDRSIIVGPLFSTDEAPSNRLGAEGQVLYSSLDTVANTKYSQAFRKIESSYNTSIIYGRRTFTDQQTGVQSSPEVLLVNVRHIDTHIINEFKAHLYEEFGIHSDRYEHLWEYEQYVRLAPVAIAALRVIGAAEDSTTIIAHEFMGIPTALAAVLDPDCDFRTIFYAHEVATVRRIVEEHPGHDIMFYNVLRQAAKEGMFIHEVFGDQNFYFKNALVEASKYFDRISAVGDYVVDELRFLAPEFEEANISVVYNGTDAYQIDVADKLASKEKLQLYCEKLLGYKPDFVFTHVTRLVPSKGLWRDLQVLEYLEEKFIASNKTAVLLLLSTEAGQRPSGDIHRMEATYNWPVAHREGWPDLSGGEAHFYTAIQQFNARSRNIKVIFINQFGFDPKNCGIRMPEDMQFVDIRKGNDVEFGMSIYEPFGISHLEPLTFGGICVVNSICGCARFARDVAGGKDVRNIIVVDYTDLQAQGVQSPVSSLKSGIDHLTRNRVERKVSKKVADEIISRLPKSKSEMERMIRTGYRLARNMSWETVVENQLLPNLLCSAVANRNC